jgi:acyl-homoserine lactone acylase PvdQ
VTAGGESGDPKSPHFSDQAVRYAKGKLRPVYFYPEDLKATSNPAIDREVRYQAPGDVAPAV